MRVSQRLFVTSLLCGFAATLTAFLVVIGHFATDEVFGPEIGGRSPTLIVALVAIGASPLIFALCMVYSAPVVLGLHFFGAENLIKRIEQVFLVGVLGFLIGMTYWALIDLLLPFYPANRDQSEIKIAAYLSAGVAGATAMLRLKQRKQIGEQDGAHQSTTAP